MKSCRTSAGFSDKLLKAAKSYLRPASKEKNKMQFLCLGYQNEAEFDQVPEEKRAKILKVCFAQCLPFRATGKVIEERGIFHSSEAKTIRAVNGVPTVTDGPFLSTKEQIGSFFIIEADNLAEAIEVASLHPAALMGEEYGFGLEIRPI